MHSISPGRGKKLTVPHVHAWPAEWDRIVLFAQSQNNQHHAGPENDQVPGHGEGLYPLGISPVEPRVLHPHVWPHWGLRSPAGQYCFPGTIQLRRALLAVTDNPGVCFPRRPTWRNRSNPSSSTSGQSQRTGPKFQQDTPISETHERRLHTVFTLSAVGGFGLTRASPTFPVSGTIR